MTNSLLLRANQTSREQVEVEPYASEARIIARFVSQKPPITMTDHLCNVYACRSTIIAMSSSTIAARKP